MTEPTGIGGSLSASSLPQIFAATTAVEVLAVAFGIAYLLLAMRQHIACWYAAFVSTALSVYLFWDVSLVMESGLNVYYLGMAVYGWFQWRRFGASGSQASAPRPVSIWPWRRHVFALLGIFVATVLSGYALAENSAASWPYLDSLTTWGGVFTTYLVAKKVLENWYYWFVIDAISIFLYLDKGLYLYALLFCVYLIIVVFGYLNWRDSYRRVAQRSTGSGIPGQSKDSNSTICR